MREQKLPRDGQIVEGMLREAGIAEWDPRVIPQILEFSYSECSLGVLCSNKPTPIPTEYVTGILEHAKTLSQHAKKKGGGPIEPEDVKLAVDTHLETSFQSPPHREVHFPQIEWTGLVF